jgi:ABC-type uncharacterized transport system YnjBCD ATPase subunit
MGYFKELEIEAMPTEQTKAKIKFEVAQMFDHLRMTQTQLKALRKKNIESQMSLLQQGAFKETSGF